MSYSDLYWETLYQIAKYLEERSQYCQKVYSLDYVKCLGECFFLSWTKDIVEISWNYDIFAVSTDGNKK